MTPEQNKSLGEVYKKFLEIQPQLDKGLESLPGHLCSDRFITLFFHELKKLYQDAFKRKAKVLTCSTESIVRCILTCVQYGLEPGVAGMIYLIPRGTELCCDLGYKGMIELCYRSERINALEAACVYKGDKFSMRKGLNPELDHVPGDGFKSPVDLLGAYAVVTMKNGTKMFEFMNAAEIDHIKTTYSKSGSYGPWVTDFDQMAKKTVIRRLLKTTPASVAMQAIMASDEGMERGDRNMHTIIDGMCEPEIQVEEPKSQAEDLMNKIKE